MAYNLSAGAIQTILSGGQVSKPTLQLLGYKKSVSERGDRYLFCISDGVERYQTTMLATQLNDLVVDGKLEKYTVVQLNKYNCPFTHPRKPIMMTDIAIIAAGADVGRQIGNTTEAKASNPSSVTEQKSKQQPISFGGSGHSNGESNANIHPISSLTPYQNRWTIRVRVTNKTAVRTWNNSKGEGKLFSMDLIDESGEMRATAFNDCVDKFYDVIEVNKVYYISRGSLKTANKAFTSIKNDYELSFNSDTTVSPCEENSEAIPMLQFDFIPIQSLEQVEKDSNVDVIGVCKNASDVQTIVTRTTNKELKKREIHLVDRSNAEVTLTLWANDAEKFDGSYNPIVAVKGVRVSDFGGRSLSAVSSSIIQINPDIKDAHVLRGWFDREGRNVESQSISSKAGLGSGVFGGTWKTFAQAKGEMLGMGEKPDYFAVKATVVMIRRENCMYMSCPADNCNKKVVDMNNGTYRCEKCVREHDSFHWRLLLSVSIADFSENQWVTCFQEAAESLLGTAAQELGMLKESNEEKFNEVLANANFKSYIFKLRTKMEMFNEENRVKTTVVNASPIEPLKYAQKLLNDIKEMEKVL